MNRSAGIDCAACGVMVPPDAARVLAERDDLAFVEVACPGCGSQSLAMLLGADGVDGVGSGRTDMAGAGATIGHQDVVAMRTFLAAYRGDLRGLIGTGRRDDRESAGPA
jgi:hypothetical protein